MFETADRGRQASQSEDLNAGDFRSEKLSVESSSHRSGDLNDGTPKTGKTTDNLQGIDLDQSARGVAGLLNQGRSDLAAGMLSKDLIKLSGDAYNLLLLKVSQNEDPEMDDDINGHLLLSDWSPQNNTWSQVFIAERDQLYRIVQPGNTVNSIAADRLGANANDDAVAKYVKNICKANHLPSPELIIRGQALKLPYPT